MRREFSDRGPQRAHGLREVGSALPSTVDTGPTELWGGSSLTHGRREEPPRGTVDRVPSRRPGGNSTTRQDGRWGSRTCKTVGQPLLVSPPGYYVGKIATLRALLGKQRIFG